MSQAGSSGAGGGGGFLNKLTGNIGGTVSQFNNNINVVGDGTTITAVGNPVTHTITLSMLPNTYAILTYTNVNSSPFVATLADYYLSVDSSTMPITIQLPNTTTTGRHWIIKDRAGNAAVNNITVTTPGGLATIDGVIAYVINTNYQSTNIVFNGINYEIW